jgi:membrane protein YqaA with SNARE-associated domain
VPALCVISFVESSFFPIPPDVLLIALALAAPSRAFRFAVWCTVASVAGGLFGYFIGAALWSTFEPLLLNRVFTAENFEAVTARYREYGGVAVFVAAFTPIPYKVFTVAAGVSRVDLLHFVAASLLGRGGRFFLVAAVIRVAGPRARRFLEEHFEVATIVGGAVLVGGFLLVKWLR